MPTLRVSTSVADAIRRATPRGSSADRVVAYLLEQAGGPAEVERALARTQDRAVARAEVAAAKRRRRGSLYVAPRQQLDLIETAVGWARTYGGGWRPEVDEAGRVHLRIRRPKPPGTLRIQRKDLDG